MHNRPDADARVAARDLNAGMAVLLAWIGWVADAPPPPDWERMRLRASHRSRFEGRELSAPGARLYAARSYASEAEPLLESPFEWIATDAGTPAANADRSPGHSGAGAGRTEIRIFRSALKVSASRDLLGRQRLVYASTPTGLLIASGEHILLASRLISRALDDDYLAAFLTSHPSAPDRTAFAAIRQLLAGETRQWCHGHPRSDRASLRPDAHCKGLSDREVIEEYRRRVIAAVGRACTGTERVGISLSAGLDSAVIAAAMHQLDRPRARKPVAVTYGFERWPAIDERTLAATLATACGFEHIRFPADDLHPLSAAGERPVCPDCPVSSPFREIKQAAYQRFEEAGVDVWLSGDFGDDLAADPRDLLADAIKRCAPRDFIAGLRERYRPAERPPRSLIDDPSIRRAIRQLLHIEPYWPRLEWLRPDHREALSSRLSSEVLSYSAFPRPLQAFHLLNARASFAASGEQWFANAHGMEARTPFRDEALVRWMLSIPAHFSYREGNWKWIMRQAFADTIPGPIRTRPKASDLTPFVDEATSDQQIQWDALAQEGLGLVSHLVSPDAGPGTDADSQWNFRWALISLALWRRAIEH